MCIRDRRWMYPHYRHDEFVDVTDEVWAAMYQAKREMENYERRKVYHRAYYSLNAYSWLENYALEHSRSPEEMCIRDSGHCAAPQYYMHGFPDPLPKYPIGLNGLTDF